MKIIWLLVGIVKTSFLLKILMIIIQNSNFVYKLNSTKTKKKKNNYNLYFIVFKKIIIFIIY